MCLAWEKKKNQSRDSPEGRVDRRGQKKRITQVGEVSTIKEKGVISTTFAMIEMDMIHPHATTLGKESSKNAKKTKVKHQIQRKVKCMNALYIVSHCNTRVTEYLFHASLAS